MKVKVATALFLALAPLCLFKAQANPAIRSTSDFPPVAIELPNRPSDLAMHDGAGLDTVLDRIEAYATDVLRNYDIQDRGTTSQLRSILRDVASAESRWADALRLSEEIRSMENKPATAMVDGIVADAYARAALVASDQDPRFREAFRSELERAVAGLDWSGADDGLRALNAEYRLLGENQTLGELRGSSNTAAAAQNMRVGFELASHILRSHLILTHYLPVRDVVIEVVGARIRSESSSMEDRWTPRLVDLEASDVKRPVIMAIWDAGFDPSLFPGRLWVNSGETLNGRDDDENGFIDDLHGIAFDENRQRFHGMLRDLPAANFGEFLTDVALLKGSFDVENSIESPEAAAFLQTFHSLPPEEAESFSLRMLYASTYSHGTLVTDVAQAGNPGARLMNGRYTHRLSTPVRQDEAYSQRIARYAQDMIGYFRAHGARVVNMSFYASEEVFLSGVAAIEPDPARRAERARSMFNIEYNAYMEAMRNSPDILFVAAAGNSSENVDFVRSFPAGINLDNVISVGAVNASLEPTNFTGYGRSIDVYANGFAIPARAPGGGQLSGSGTSIAAPAVTNLAGKIWAVNPDLTVAQVRAIIEETATPEGPEGLKVVHPRAAIERVRSLTAQNSRD